MLADQDEDYAYANWLPQKPVLLWSSFIYQIYVTRIRIQISRTAMGNSKSLALRRGHNQWINYLVWLWAYYPLGTNIRVWFWVGGSAFIFRVLFWGRGSAFISKSCFEEGAVDGNCGLATEACLAIEVLLTACLKGEWRRKKRETSVECAMSAYVAGQKTLNSLLPFGC